jgi:hypothetical protein
MKSKFLILLFLISLSNLAHALYGARSLTSSSVMPPLVTLHLNDSSKPEYDDFCSGVLVAPDKVLTTGHCIEVVGTKAYDQWNVLTYEPQLLKVKFAGVNYDVADVVIAPSYAEALGYAGEDLAIIKLKKPLIKIKPIKIVSRYALKPGMKISMAVRGKIADSLITSIKTYSGNMIVFTDGSKSGVCEGDSGGALLVTIGKDVMLGGILSAQSEGCERRTGVSVFPRIFL